MQQSHVSGDWLVPTQGSVASLREDAKSLGKGAVLCKSPRSLPVEVVIIVVIFNMFMTWEAEGAALHGVWGAQHGRYPLSCSSGKGPAHPAC